MLKCSILVRLNLEYINFFFGNFVDYLIQFWPPTQRITVTVRFQFEPVLKILKSKEPRTEPSVLCGSVQPVLVLWSSSELNFGNTNYFTYPRQLHTPTHIKALVDWTVWRWNCPLPTSLIPNPIICKTKKGPRLVIHVLINSAVQSSNLKRNWTYQHD